MKRCTWCATFVVWFFAWTFAPLAAAADTTLKPLAEWQGSVAEVSLQKIAPPVITTSEGLGIIWKAWNVAGEVPELDFQETVVLATTEVAGNLKVRLTIDEAGNVTTDRLPSGNVKAGFRYVLSAVPMGGVASVDGVALKRALSNRELPNVLPTAKSYRPAEKLEGELKFVGSTSMSHLLNLWNDGFSKFHPKLQVDVACEGSELSLPELSKDDTVIAAMSRPLLKEEQAAWEKQLGRQVLAFPVCIDDIAIVVNQKNPLLQLSTEQLKQIYAPSKEPLSWSALGAPGEFGRQPLTMHGRSDTSGIRHYLRSLAVGYQGQERETHVCNSDKELVDCVAAEDGAIGYCRAVHVNDKVRPIVITSKDRRPRSFLQRTCFLVVAPASGDKPSAAASEFLQYVYRLEGQSALFRDGYHALDKSVIGEQLDRLGVEDVK